ncbi:MAG: DUF502 domain-containing protein [Phycisphaerae bacterium]
MGEVSAFDDFRRFFLRGITALLPTLLTIAVLIWAYRLVNDYVGVYVTRSLLFACSLISVEPALDWIDEDNDPIRFGQPIDDWDADGRRLTVEYRTIHHDALRSTDPVVRARAVRARGEALWQIAAAKYHLHLVGFVIAIILVYFVGIFLASFIGRASWRVAERLLYRVPLIRAVYPNIKQVTDFLLSDKEYAFSSVVAVQYPRKGCWSLGLRTGGGMPSMRRHTSADLVTVFVPSSPTPVTGYVVQVPREDVVELKMSIDEALRFTISAGVIDPDVALSAVPRKDA